MSPALVVAVALALAPPPEIARPVTDLAGVLAPGHEEAIARELVELRAATGVQLAVLIVDTTHGQDLADFAQATFDRWGGGTAERDDGALFVLAVADRRNRLHVGYGLEAIIPDVTARHMLDALRPRLRDGDYAGATLQLVRDVRARTAHIVPGAPIRPRLGAHPWVWVIVALLGLGGGVAWGRGFRRWWRARRAAGSFARDRRLQRVAAALVAVQLAVLWAFDLGGGFAAVYSLILWLFVPVGWLVGGARRGYAIAVGILAGGVLAVATAAALRLPPHGDGGAALAAAAPYLIVLAVLLFFMLFAVVGAGAAEGSGSSAGSSSSNASAYAGSSSSYSSSSSSDHSSSSWSGGGGSSGGGGASSSW